MFLTHWQLCGEEDDRRFIVIPWTFIIIQIIFTKCLYVKTVCKLLLMDGKGEDIFIPLFPLLIFSRLVIWPNLTYVYGLSYGCDG